MVDQVGRSVTIDVPARKIISIVPSQTELLFDLGLDDEVAGITKFCIHPDEWFRSKTRVGGTKKLNMDVIDSIKPDLILANKEENQKEDLLELMQRYPVWISDIKDRKDALKMIHDVGSLTGKNAEAGKLITDIGSAFSKSLPVSGKAIYLIWNDPYMAAGGDTFISDMMKYAGFENCLQSDRYPVLTEAEIRNAAPEYILLSSEPFPFKEKHREQFMELYPGSKVILVDGEMFSWYGSRMLKAPDYFQALYKDRKGD